MYCGGPDTGCMSHPYQPTSHGPRCAEWSGHPDHVHDTIARLTRERDEAREDLAYQEECVREAHGVTAHVRELHAAAQAEVERLRAIVDAVEAEVSVTFAALGGGQHAGMPPLPASVAQRWRRILASVSPPAPDPSEEA